MKKKNQKYYLSLLLIFITAIVFCRVFSHEFLFWDDNVHVYENPYMDNITFSRIIHFWKEPHNFALTYTVWAIQTKFAKSPDSEESINKFNPRVFHTTNLIIHLLSVLIVFAILNILAKNNWAAFGGALLFALHPVQVEPVAWVTGLKDILSGSLSLAAIWQYLVYSKLASSGSLQAKKNYQKYLHYSLAFLAFMLAMTSKPTTVVIPVIILTLDFLILRRTLKKSIIRLIPWFILTVPVIILTMRSQSAANIGAVTPVLQRPLIMLDALAYYIYKLIIPIKIGPDYGRSPKFVLQQGFIYFTWLFPCILAVLCWVWRKKRPWLLASAGIFFIGVLPVLGLVPFIFQTISTVADRYIYFAMLGPAMITTWLILRNQKKRMIIVILAGFLSFLGIQCFIQTGYWKNTEMIFRHSLRINPDSWMAYNNLGIILGKKKKFKEAGDYYNRSVQINPNYSRARYNLGYMLEKQNNFEQAIIQYNAALKIDSSFIEPRNNLGILLAKMGKYKESAAQFSNALRINPEFAKAYYNMGVVLTMQRKYKESIPYFTKAIQTDPNYAEAHNNLGSVLELQGRIAEAIKHYSTAISIIPNYKDAQNNLQRAFQKQKKSETHY